MELTQIQYVVRTVSHLIVAIVLILLLLGILTWTGLLKCSLIPGWCEIYYSVVGQPKILIVHGTDGMGDPEALAELLASPKLVGVRPRVHSLDFVSIENLKQYNLVIVEKAKTMSTKKMRDLMQYADAGGRLVWVADAGTKLTREDEFLYEDELYEGAEHKIISPWARKEKGEVVNLENYISVRFKANYCDIASCDETKTQLSGRLIATSTDHSLVYGMQQYLPFRGDFTVVKEVGGVATKIVLNIDTDFPLKVGEEELGEVVPVIVTSGIGEKIAYYAFPPEQLVEKMEYSVLLENLYYGMLE